MTMSMTVGRDYRGHGIYEYVITAPAAGDDNWDIVARQGWFRSSTQARRAGETKARELLQGVDCSA